MRNPSERPLKICDAEGRRFRFSQSSSSIVVEDGQLLSAEHRYKDLDTQVGKTANVDLSREGVTHESLRM